MTDASTLAAKAKTEAEAVVSWLRETCPSIETPERAQWAADAVGTIAKQRDEVEKQRKEIKAPILEAGRKIDALFKPAIKMYATAETYLKNQIGVYRNAERARQAQALREATTQAEIVRAVDVLTPTPSGVTERTVRTGRVVDEAKLPREYWTIDQAKIDRVIRAGGSIPGVEVITDTQVVRSAKR